MSLPAIGMFVRKYWRRKWKLFEGCLWESIWYVCTCKSYFYREEWDFLCLLVVVPACGNGILSACGNFWMGFFVCLWSLLKLWGVCLSACGNFWMGFFVCLWSLLKLWGVCLSACGVCLNFEESAFGTSAFGEILGSSRRTTDVVLLGPDIQ